MNQRRWAVGLIVVAQWLGTSLWFSPNSAADDLMAAWQIGPAQFAWLIAATQSGFIAGTLWLAYSGWADRYSTSRIFALACVLGAMINADFSGAWTGFESGLLFRFAVGVCLAGIYPLGMKMIVGWVGTQSGSALGLLVGMLTLGTALPHGIRTLGASLPWQTVIQASSVLASGLMCLIYPLLAQDWVVLRFVALLVWGFFVVADSPQFSSISARSCPPEWVGSALALQNSIGFFITIVSITLMLGVIEALGSQALWLLVPGPVLGLMGLWPLLKKTRAGRVQPDRACN